MEKQIDPRTSIDDLAVVIRSAGERTEQLCRELVLAQGVPAENLRLVNKTPFSAALRASYEAAIALAHAWTLCLDADVLLAPGSIQRLMSLTPQRHPSLFEIQCLVLDKFFGGPREAGNHLYRTALLPQALECIPPDSNEMRPEWRTLEAMKARGFFWQRTDRVIGLHGFEQYYSDIFRTCFVHARKHRDHAEIFLSYWPERRAQDDDYLVAIRGLTAGLEFDGDITIDREEHVYRKGFEQLGIAEKPALPAESVTPSDIDRMIAEWELPPVYRKYFPHENGLLLPTGRFRRRLREMGPLRLALFALGRGLERAGAWIRSRVESP